MGFNSFLRSPKREEEQVPDDTEFKETYGDEDIDFMDGILGIEDDEDQQLSGDNINNVYDDRFNWDFMDWDEFQDDDDEEEKGEQKKKQVSNKAVKKEESIGFWDEDDKKVALNLNLNYQDVLDAWSNRGTLWTDDCSLSMPNITYMGEVPVLEEEKSRREASVLRYKEKRQTRLFSKKIRYQVRKLNADKRPRLKGRFVKRVVPEKMLK